MRARPPPHLTPAIFAMTAHLPPPSRIAMLLLLLTMTAGGAWCQSLLDPASRQCQTLGAAPVVRGHRGAPPNEYPAGGVLMALAEVPAGVSGALEFYLCLEEGNTQEEECLIRVPLQLADGSGTSFSLETVPRADAYEIPLIVPDEVTCDACTLQLRVVMSDCDDLNSCKASDETFCADIAIREIKKSEKRLFSLITSILGGMLG